MGVNSLCKTVAQQRQAAIWTWALVRLSPICYSLGYRVTQWVTVPDDTWWARTELITGFAAQIRNALTLISTASSCKVFVNSSSCPRKKSSTNIKRMFLLTLSAATGHVYCVCVCMSGCGRYFTSVWLLTMPYCLQCFDAVCWVAGSASGL